MKKALQFLVLIAVLLISFSHDATAQKKKKKKRSVDEYFDDRGSFTDRLWYGADFTLNFFSVPGGNAFNAGISPMVGYKITDQLSVGPRLELLYRGERYNVGVGDDLKFNSTNYGIGAFSRFKILEMYFIHAEYQALSNEIGVITNGGILVEDDEIVTTRDWQDNFFIGGGYGATGGGVGFQVSILWNLLEEFSSNTIPLYYRIGINYKF